jgi:hypothetical protein
VFGPARSQNKTRSSARASTINYCWKCNSAGNNVDVVHLFCTATASFAKFWFATTKETTDKESTCREASSTTRTRATRMNQRGKLYDWNIEVCALTLLIPIYNNNKSNNKTTTATMQRCVMVVVAAETGQERSCGHCLLFQVERIRYQARLIISARGFVVVACGTITSFVVAAIYGPGRPIVERKI